MISSEMGVMLSQAVVSGLLIGAVYAFLALGLTLIFGVMHVINIAHGEMLMLGAYTSFWMFTLFGMNPLLAIVVSAPAMFVLGTLIEKFTIERIVEDIETNSLLLTFGISICIMNLAIWLWTTDYKAIPFFTGSWIAGPLVFPKSRMVGAALSVAFTLITYLFLKFSRLGKAIRATADSRDLSSICGIYVKRIYLITYGLASAMGATAGALVSIMFAVYPEMGESFLMRSFTVIVLGGMGHPIGAILGGILLGLSEGIGSLYLSGEGGGAITFVILLLVLLFRPAGLMGKRTE
ncbi:MAG TPA: branched-chain amino acid ABC transporter permease [Nitrospinae bacterium]|nr:branched-chain amino acid ABC transporter permease [Nitrospinota bacterium]